MPQFEALEMYAFLKESCENKKLDEIFKEWYDKSGFFEGRIKLGVNKKAQIELFGPTEGSFEEDKLVFQDVYSVLEQFRQSYPNYIFALTMGLGKTILMATCIFYEFILANKYPQSPLYAHNALVFAPDKTVLLSLREIEQFDWTKVVPKQYVSFLSNIRFSYLEDSGVILSTIDGSKYNIIVSNVQKIIVKKTHKEKTGAQKLYNEPVEQLDDFQRLLMSDDFIENDKELVGNQRFRKLQNLKNLAVYVDEAHHVFGTKLEKTMTYKKATSLRLTIDLLAAAFKVKGTHMVGCYNFTGTPYIGKKLLPEVVYSYGLRKAIENSYLKRVKSLTYENIKEKTETFLKDTVTSFWEKYGENRYEGMLPKLAIFCTNVEEEIPEVKATLEKVLADLDIDTSKILVNVGNPKYTNNDDLREFKKLDSKESNKQFILLVNKGKEGWNCRSLFGVAMHREPRSKIFVLQATMRCLRKITDVQQTGTIYLAKECETILNKELEKNFNVSLDDITTAGESTKQVYQVKPVPPPVTITIQRVRKHYTLKEKTIQKGFPIGLKEIDTSRFEVTKGEGDILSMGERVVGKQKVDAIAENKEYSAYTLEAEVARYLNRSPIFISDVLAATAEGTAAIVDLVNQYNEVLYEYVIPKLFHELYEIEFEDRVSEPDELQLVEEPPHGYYGVTADPEKVFSLTDEEIAPYKDKSFHLDHYCFDSNPEKEFFWKLLQSKSISKIWFTGMLTHGQSKFVVYYIDPHSKTVRSYFPDFLLQLPDGTYQIIEIKGDNKIDDDIVQAKAAYAEQLATANKMVYRMVAGSRVGEFEV